MAESNDITGWAVPVAAHGRELSAHDQPRVRGVADQRVLPPPRHRVQVKGREGGGALLPRRLLRSCGAHRPLPAWGPPIKLRLGMRKGRAGMLSDQPFTVGISRLRKKKTSFPFIVIWTTSPFERQMPLKQ